MRIAAGRRGRPRHGVGAAIALAAVTVIAGCGEERSPERDLLTAAIEQASRAAAAERPRRVVEIRLLTDFAWDRAYVFVAYAYDEDVEKALGFRAPVPAPDSEHENLIVFVRGREVVGSAANLQQVELGCLAEVRPLTPATFRYLVRRDPVEGIDLAVPFGAHGRAVRRREAERCIERYKPGGPPAPPIPPEKQRPS